MAFLNLQSVSLAFHGTAIFDDIRLTVEASEKVALVGRNGSGKSTLLKLIAGSLRADAGTIATQKGIRVAYLDQEVPGEMPGTVLEAVKGDLNGAHGHEDTLNQRAEKAISQLGLDAGWVFNSLSAGMKRKVLLARALASEPDILLLDEPTNHLDIDSIKRLEEILIKFKGALIFVTHDRMFLQNIATRIVEIDRGRLFDQVCGYQTFLERRAAAGEVEQIQNALFDKKLVKEEAWRRKGVQARGTRNEGRVRELEKLRSIRGDRREPPGAIILEA
jgi:ATP-binding cassette subfamily F protein uup